MVVLKCNFCPEDALSDRKNYERCDLANGGPCVHCSEAIDLVATIVQTRNGLSDLLVRRQDFHKALHSTNKDVNLYCDRGCSLSQVTLFECEFCEANHSGDSKHTQEYTCSELANGEPCSLCSEVINLDSLVYQTIKDLHILFVRQRALHEDINGTHESIIHHLPPEISASIFLFSLSDDLPVSALGSKAGTKSKGLAIATPLTLGAVCHVWRNIVWAEPRLWTIISVPINLGAGYEYNDIVNAWINKSGQLPLSFYIYTPPAALLDQPVDLPLSPVSDLIHRHLPRCRSLDLSCPISLLPAVKGEAPLLERLKITSDNDESDIRPIELYSTKSAGVSVSVTGYYLPSLIIPFTNVTEFEGLITLEECVSVLQKSPALKECRILGFKQRAAPSNSSESIVHNRLEKLALQASRHPSYIILEALNLPSLTHLTASFASPSAIRRFILRSSCNLQYLYLNVLSCESGSLCDMLHSADSLKELYLVEDDVSQFHANVFFKALAQNPVIQQPTNPGSINAGSALLPNLSILSIKFREEVDFPWDLASGIFGSMDDIRHPRRRPIRDFRIIYDWRIGNSTNATSRYNCQVYTYGQPMPTATLYLDEAITRRFLDIVHEGIEIRLYDAYTNDDILRLSLDRHNIAVPEWYKIKETTGISAFDEIEVASYTDSSDSEEVSESEGCSSNSSDRESDSEESEAHSESDILDAAYDPYVGLPAHVTGSTLDFI